MRRVLHSAPSRAVVAAEKWSTTLPEAIDAPRCPALLIAQDAHTADGAEVARLDIENAFLPALGIPDFSRPAMFKIVANILSPWSRAETPFRVRLYVENDAGDEIGVVSEADITAHRVSPYEPGDALQHLVSLTARITFPAPDRYWVALSADGAEIARTPFRVLPV